MAFQPLGGLRRPQKSHDDDIRAAICGFDNTLTSTNTTLCSEDLTMSQVSTKPNAPDPQREDPNLHAVLLAGPSAVPLVGWFRCLLSFVDLATLVSCSHPTNPSFFVFVLVGHFQSSMPHY